MTYGVSLKQYEAALAQKSASHIVCLQQIWLTVEESTFEILHAFV